MAVLSFPALLHHDLRVAITAVHLRLLLRLRDWALLTALGLGAIHFIPWFLLKALEVARQLRDGQIREVLLWVAASVISSVR